MQTRPGGAGFAQAIRVISRFGSLLREAGMTLLYHNHDFEFVNVSGQYGLDFLYDAVPSDILQTELDVCWVKYAGINPAEYIRKYAGRCPVVHLKDYVCSVKDDATPYALIGQAEKKNEDAPAFTFRPFGYGSQNVEEVLEAGIESGAEWFIIEQDSSIGRTPLEAAEMSIGTLKRVGLK